MATSSKGVVGHELKGVVGRGGGGDCCWFSTAVKGAGSVHGVDGGLLLACGVKVAP